MTTASKAITQTPRKCKLYRLLTVCVKKQFTGQFDIRSLRGHLWTLTFFMGRLVKADGGEHPLRRWRRQLSLHCPQLHLDPVDDLSPDDLLSSETWSYDALVDLVEQRQASLEQVGKVVEGCLVEVLFDLLQAEERFEYLSIEAHRNAGANSSPEILQNPPIIPTGTKYLWQQAQRAWSAWNAAGLVNRSPNLAPSILSLEKLEDQLKPPKSDGVKTFLGLINGHRTLRDLAIKVGHSPLQLLKFLMPYVGQGLIDLVTLPDLDFDLEADLSPVTVAATHPLPFIAATSADLPKQSSPLIAGVDDSALYTKVMGEILVGGGYQFVGIKDAFRALPILLEQTPDLIILDLVMPIVNGYEICAQIRRSSRLKKTPVIIVTSSDTMIDRMRAKLSGASGFISKPFEAEQLLGVVSKHLQSRSTDSSQIMESFASA